MSCHIQRNRAGKDAGQLRNPARGEAIMDALLLSAARPEAVQSGTVVYAVLRASRLFRMGSHGVATLFPLPLSFTLLSSRPGCGPGNRSAECTPEVCFRFTRRSVLDQHRCCSKGQHETKENDFVR